MVLVLVATALAGPMRCEAVYTGAPGACELSGTWSASGVGKSESRARKAARGRLGALVQAAALHRGTRGAGAGAVALAQQHAAACLAGLDSAAQVHCFEEPALGQRAGGASEMVCAPGSQQPWQHLIAGVPPVAKFRNK